MNPPYPRHIEFDSMPNFRDLGGCRVGRGRAMAWRRVFRAAAVHAMTPMDVARLKEDIRPRTVIDLRTPRELTRQREISQLDEIGARYHNVPFRPASPDYARRGVLVP